MIFKEINLFDQRHDLFIIQKFSEKLFLLPNQLYKTAFSSKIPVIQDHNHRTNINFISISS